MLQPKAGIFRWPLKSDIILWFRWDRVGYVCGARQQDLAAHRDDAWKGKEPRLISSFFFEKNKNKIGTFSWNADCEWPGHEALLHARPPDAQAIPHRQLRHHLQRRFKTTQYEGKGRGDLKYSSIFGYEYFITKRYSFFPFLYRFDSNVLLVRRF